MEYVLMVVFLGLFILGIFNYVEIRKMKKIKSQKEVTLNLIDRYMKLYWDLLPNLIQKAKKSKCDKKGLEEVILTRNHIYDRMDISTKLLSHVKIEECLKKLNFDGSKELLDQRSRLEEIENQILNISKEYERLNGILEEKKQNPFLKIFVFLFKL